MAIYRNSDMAYQVMDCSALCWYIEPVSSLHRNDLSGLGTSAKMPPHKRGDKTMIKITDLVISPKSLGNKLWLVDVAPAYEYKNNQRTDNVTGYRYTVCAVEKGLEKINVRIDGPQQLEKPESYADVKFDGLEIFIYWSNGQPQVAAKATGISLVNAKP